jgi:hypothetical protein
MANAVAITNIPVAGGLQAAAMGAVGSDYITNTTNLDGVAANVVWGIITAITTATFTTLTSTTTSLNGAAAGGSGNLNGLVLAAGQSIYGRFTTITLASGSVMAYRVQVQ